MTVPTFAEVNRIGSAATMRDLIRRDDLPEDPRWWLAVISVGQAGLLGAESGQVDAEDWAAVLVASLDAAARRPAVGVAETVHRRMMACVAAMHYFGERAGDPVRDPELVFRHFAASLGGAPEAYLERYRETLAAALAEHRRLLAGQGGSRRAVNTARAWLDSTRAALTQMCHELAPRLAETPQAVGETPPQRDETVRGGEAVAERQRGEVARWCAASAEIEQIRAAAKQDG
jgi:hypothetical protein